MGIAQENGACNKRMMITVDQLCAEVERRGRHLTPRAARDWWTKGLLPRPIRRGLGRGKGTETFWADRRIIDQAAAAYDLLASHSRTYTAIIGLWLRGFPVEVSTVRRAYLSMINRNSFWRHRRTKPQDAEDAIAELVPRLANRLLRPRSPQIIKNELTDLLLEFMTGFYGIEDQSDFEGLSLNWAMALPYLRDQPHTTFHLTDEHLRWCIDRLCDWCSLPRQLDTIRTAHDHDLVRARRILHLALGTLWRSAPPASRRDLDGIGDHAVIAFGRPAVPILARLLSQREGREITYWLLRFAVAVRANSSVLALPDFARRQTTRGTIEAHVGQSG